MLPAILLLIFSLLLHPAHCSLLVLGAGLTGTGTQSQARALELLGYKVFHSGRDLPWESRDFQRLYTRALVDDSALDELVKEITERGFNATMGAGLAVLVPRLMRRVPNARVVLGSTEDLAGWEKEFNWVWGNQSVWVHDPPFRFVMDWTWKVSLFDEDLGGGFWVAKKPCTNYMKYLPWVVMFRPVFCELKFSKPAKFLYEYHQARITGLQLPKEQILKFDVKQGWGPLLEFFGREPNDPLSTTEFPKIVNNKDFDMAYLVLSKITFFIVLTWPVLILIAMYIILKGVLSIFGAGRSTKSSKQKSA